MGNGYLRIFHKHTKDGMGFKLTGMLTRCAKKNANNTHFFHFMISILWKKGNSIHIILPKVMQTGIKSM